MLYYTTTFFLNGVAIAGGIVSELDIHDMWTSRYGNNYNNNYNNGRYYNHQYSGNTRYDRCDTWFFVNAVFGVLHILAALYIVRKMEEPATPVEPTAPQEAAPYYLQPDGVMVAPVPDPESGRRRIVKKNAHKSSAPPNSWKRIRHVLCENPVVALYIVVFLVYVAWQYFLDEQPCSRGMAFAMKCADLFIMAGPASFVFSLIMMMLQRGNI